MNMLSKHEQRNGRASVAPGVFVAFSAGSHERLSYKLWEEKSMPSFLLEVLSDSSAAKDMVTNRDLFARLGIEEFWLFDPEGQTIEGQLVGLRLRGGAYEPIPPLSGWTDYRNAVLNLEFRNESGHLRIRDPATGGDLTSQQEAVEDYRREREARQAAETRIAELEAALGRKPELSG